jgi:hypothetical protein
MTFLRLFGNRSPTIGGHGADPCRHAAQEFINNSDSATNQEKRGNPPIAIDRTGRSPYCPQHKHRRMCKKTSIERGVNDSVFYALPKILEKMECLASRQVSVRSIE